MKQDFKETAANSPRALLALLAAALLVSACTAAPYGGQGGHAATGDAPARERTQDSAKASDDAEPGARRILVGLWNEDEIGSLLTQEDLALASETIQKTLEGVPNGTSSAWENAETGVGGSITPIQTYRTAEGTYCRRFEAVINTGDRSATRRNIACRQQNGGWMLNMN